MDKQVLFLNAMSFSLLLLDLNHCCLYRSRCCYRTLPKVEHSHFLNKKTRFQIKRKSRTFQDFNQLLPLFSPDLHLRKQYRNLVRHYHCCKEFQLQLPVMTSYKANHAWLPDRSDHSHEGSGHRGTILPLED